MPPADRTRSAVVLPDGEGLRLDRWLTQADPDTSRSQFQRWIDGGLVLVDGRARPASFKLHAGQTVQWTSPPPVQPHLVAQADVPLQILYQDAELAVIDKPAGVVVHPAPGHAQGTLVHGLLARLVDLSGVGGVLRPGIVHRLDKGTSGLLVVAKSDRAHRELQQQLRARTLVRIYRALCWGVPRPAAGEIDAPLARHPSDRKRQAVREGGRSAVTQYRVDQQLQGAALLTLQLRTGRTHQIRVHLLHVGHPVLGDTVYGGGAARLRGTAPAHRPALRTALAALDRPALHASRLALQHPTTGERLEFDAPLPADFRVALRALGSLD